MFNKYCSNPIFSPRTKIPKRMTLTYKLKLSPFGINQDHVSNLVLINQNVLFFFTFSSSLLTHTMQCLCVEGIQPILSLDNPIIFIYKKFSQKLDRKIIHIKCIFYLINIYKNLIFQELSTTILFF